MRARRLHGNDKRGHRSRARVLDGKEGGVKKRGGCSGGIGPRKECQTLKWRAKRRNKDERTILFNILPPFNFVPGTAADDR